MALLAALLLCGCMVRGVGGFVAVQPTLTAPTYSLHRRAALPSPSSVSTSPRSSRRQAASPLSGAYCKEMIFTHSYKEMSFKYTKIKKETHPGISVWDVTPDIRKAVEEAGIKEGFVNVINQHTTTAVTINEYESRLVDDVRQFLLRLAPPTAPYLHNDLHLRPQGVLDTQKVVKLGWDIENNPAKLREWRAQEPLNAHSHLLGMLLGNSETIPVADGKLCIGQWQSVMLVDIDGPRTRSLGIQVVGHD